MSAIEASSGTYRSRVDGTIVLSVEIEPRNAAAALALFGMPGTPLAIAALQVGYAAASTNKESLTVEKPKGGPLAKLAGIWCHDPEFWKWLETDPDNACHSAQGAAHCLYAICGIESRVELDNDPAAAERFHRLIRGPYSRHLVARGIVA